MSNLMVNNPDFAPLTEAAQEAYNAYAQSVLRAEGVSLPEWQDVADQQKEHWLEALDPMMSKKAEMSTFLMESGVMVKFLKWRKKNSLFLEDLR